MKTLSKVSIAAGLLLFLSRAQAQTTPLSCVVLVGVVPIGRAEGQSDFVGDEVLDCTGGAITPAGVAAPLVNVSYFLNTNITSRLLAPDWSEVLLMIDEPAPGSQLLCGAPGTVESSPGVCSITGTPTGAGVYDGTGARANVFQAQKAAVGNELLWKIPLAAPAAGGHRYIRFTNIRAADALLGAPIPPAGVMSFVSISGPVSVLLDAPLQTVAFLQPGLNFAVPAPPSLSRCVPQNLPLFLSPAADGTPTFSVRFSEGYLNAWAARPMPPVAQNSPGFLYFTETGFYNPAFPTILGRGNLGLAGLADQGTRLRLHLTSIPASLQLFVKASANLVRQSDGLPSGGSVHLASVAADGSGPYVATPGNAFGIAPLPIAGGSATAVFEVLSADLTRAERVDIPIYVAYEKAHHGTADAAGTLAPVSPLNTASLTAPVPRFADIGSPHAAFTLTPSCAH